MSEGRGREADALAPPDRFLEVFRLAALQAGSVARHLQGDVVPRTKSGFDNPEASALSAVDLAAQDVILHLLNELLPGIAVDAEEETETRELFAPSGEGVPLVVVDPIDGSYNYLRGSPDYAVMGAWVEGGRYEAAVVNLPAHRAVWWARRERGCRGRRWGEPAREVRLERLPERILISPRVPEEWRQALRHLGLEVEVCRCSAVEAAAPVLGRAAAAVSPLPLARRRAVALLLSLAAGATVLIGDEPWDGTDPQDLPPRRGALIVADRPELAARIGSVLTGAGPGGPA